MTGLLRPVNFHWFFCDVHVLVEGVPRRIEYHALALDELEARKKAREVATTTYPRGVVYQIDVVEEDAPPAAYDQGPTR